MDDLSDADALEQELDEGVGEPAQIAPDPEASEADLIAQAQVVEVREALDALSTDPEAPEADALEQAEVVRPDLEEPL